MRVVQQWSFGCRQRLLLATCSFASLFKSKAHNRKHPEQSFVSRHRAQHIHDHTTDFWVDLCNLDFAFTLRRFHTSQSLDRKQASEQESERMNRKWRDSAAMVSHHDDRFVYLSCLSVLSAMQFAHADMPASQCGVKSCSTHTHKRVLVHNHTRAHQKA